MSCFNFVMQQAILLQAEMAMVFDIESQGETRGWKHGRWYQPPAGGQLYQPAHSLAPVGF